jgi:hypothetical protein
MRVVNKKVVAEHGRQPNVAVKGDSVRPMLHARHQGKWVAVDWRATVGEVGASKLKYSDIVDNLKLITVGTYVHWAASNALQH